MLWQADQRTGIEPGFNPRPAVRPGDAGILDAQPESARTFQSAPGREAGRCRA